MYRTVTLMVVMLALVVGITMVPAQAASSVDNHQPPSLMTGITLRDPVYLEPLWFLVGNLDGSVGRTTQFFDTMIIGRDDGLVMVCSLGGYAGDRNLKTLIARIRMRPVIDRVEPPKQGDDQERCLARRIDDARRRFQGGSDYRYSVPGHFAPFFWTDAGGELTLVLDTGILLYGAWSVDFAVKQEGKYNALTGVDARSFNIDPGRTPGLISQAACQPAPPPQQGAGCRQDAPPQQEGNYPTATPETNASDGTYQVHKDAFVAPKPQLPTSGELEAAAQVFSTAASAAQQVREAAPAGTSEFPLVSDIVSSLGSAEERTLSPEARKVLGWWAEGKEYTGPLMAPAFVPSSDGKTRVAWFFVGGGKLYTEGEYRFTCNTGWPTRSSFSAQYPSGVVSVNWMWLDATTRRDLRGGDEIHIRNRANTADVRIIRLSQGCTAWVPVFVDAAGNDIADLRVMTQTQGGN